METAGALPCNVRGRYGTECYGAKWRGLFLGRRLQRAVEPPVVRGFHARSARLHVILRVEMRTRRIGRADGLHDRELTILKERLQRREARMKTEETVEVKCSVRTAAARLRNRDRRPQMVVIRLSEWNDDVQAVHRAALKQHDHLFLARRRRRRNSALQERRQRGHAQHRDPAVLQKISPRNCHGRAPVMPIQNVT